MKIAIEDEIIWKDVWTIPIQKPLFIRCTLSSSSSNDLTVNMLAGEVAIFSSSDLSMSSPIPKANTLAFNSKRRYQKLAITVLFLQKYTKNLVISRCCFAEDDKEMYQDSKRTCTAIVLLIKLFVWCQSRCCRPFGLLKLPIVSRNAFYSSRSEKNIFFNVDIVVKNKLKCGLAWFVLFFATIASNLAIWLANLPLPIRVHTTLLALMCRDAFFSWSSEKTFFLSKCGLSWSVLLLKASTRHYFCLKHFFLIVSACWADLQRFWKEILRHRSSSSALFSGCTFMSESVKSFQRFLSSLQRYASSQWSKLFLDSLSCASWV